MRIKTKQEFGVNLGLVGLSWSQNSLREITGKVRTMPGGKILHQCHLNSMLFDCIDSFDMLPQRETMLCVFTIVLTRAKKCKGGVLVALTLLSTFRCSQTRIGFYYIQDGSHSTDAIKFISFAKYAIFKSLQAPIVQWMFILQWSILPIFPIFGCYVH